MMVFWTNPMPLPLSLDVHAMRYARGYSCSPRRRSVRWRGPILYSGVPRHTPQQGGFSKPAKSKSHPDHSLITLRFHVH